MALPFLQTKLSLARLITCLAFSIALILFCTSTPGRDTISSIRSASSRRSNPASISTDEKLSRRQSTETDSTLVQITSPDQTNIAFTSANGNLYLEPQGGSNSSSSSNSTGFDTTTYFYASDDGSVVTDYQGRVFSIYSGEVAAYGVSRLRLHDLSMLPVTSVLVTLIPVVNAATGGSTLVATTSNGQFFYLAACNLDSEDTKIFAISSNPGGINTLESVAVQDVITGGNVEECVLINLTDGVVGRTS